MSSHVRFKLLLLLFIFFLPIKSINARTDFTPSNKEQHKQECVILLHGLARSASSMENIVAHLHDHGYITVNQAYPSRTATIETLSTEYIPPALKQCEQQRATSIHFVTHSMGGILVRYYISLNPIEKLGRVVMLSPPSQGSEVVDRLKDMPGFYLLNGPAGQQLGTDRNSLPSRLGKADFDVGIITGNRSVNFILSLLIPGADDGKVSVDRARLEGMHDFLVVPFSHPFIMKRDAVIAQTMHYLQSGSFLHQEE